MAGRRAARVRRPCRQPGQGQGLPHRTRGDRVGARPARDRRPRHGRRTRGRARRQTGRGVRGRGRGPPDGPGSPARAHRRSAPRVHGALRHRRARRVPADAQRQGRPQGPARAGTRRLHHRPGTRDRGGGGPVRPLRRGAGPGDGRRRRQLLHPGRPLPARHPPGQPGPLRPGRGTRHPRPLRGADPGRAGRTGRRGRRCPSCAARGKPARRGAAVLRPAQAVVPQPDGRPERHLQHPAGRQAARPRRPGRARWGTRRRRGTPRDPAHRLPCHRRRTPPAGAARRPDPHGLHLRRHRRGRARPGTRTGSARHWPPKPPADST